jgi:hypothetical protein
LSNGPDNNAATSPDSICKRIKPPCATGANPEFPDENPAAATGPTKNPTAIGHEAVGNECNRSAATAQAGPAPREAAY